VRAHGLRPGAQAGRIPFDRGPVTTVVVRDEHDGLADEVLGIAGLHAGAIDLEDRRYGVRRRPGVVAEHRPDVPRVRSPVAEHAAMEQRPEWLEQELEGGRDAEVPAGAA